MLTKRLVAVGATVLTGILVAPTALAVPTEGEIETVRGETEQTRRAIAEAEVDLTRVSVAHEAALLRVQIAAEEFNTAQEALNQAQAEAQAAQSELSAALADLEEARVLVAGIAMSAYRNGGNFGQLAMFLQADGISTAISSANTYSILGNHADNAHQKFQAATIAADLAQERSERAVISQQAAVDAVSDAYEQTAAEAEAAQAELDRAAADEDALIRRLATLRNTTVEMERERQAHLDEQQRERDNLAAQAEIQRQQEQQESRPTPSPSASPDLRPTASPSPTPTSTPTPTPTPTSTPSPTPTPTPTSTPTPTPTPTPSPTSTPTPTPSPTPTPTPTPPAPSGKGATALAWAKTQIGKPYVWGAAGPDSYDCSGLTMMAFKQAGVTLPRNSAAQYGVGTKVPVDQMQAGDLFFYSNNGAQSGIYHVAIYAGNGMRLHAPSPGKSVELVPMWWTNVLPQAVRF